MGVRASRRPRACNSLDIGRVPVEFIRHRPSARCKPNIHKSWIPSPGEAKLLPSSRPRVFGKGAKS
ncbi:conserved hypothetical protein [Ricinus communis]|uniref:Uncharacterized protein n=1 Tax=Ricinus communis TaxID=3988 RepID=B9RQ56_RICCO|nr:conserved hypothetical protein [Ricinus communis]